MKKIIVILILVVVGKLAAAQEFPIAIGNDNTFSGGAAFDGTNYLIGITGDLTSSDNITAQLVSAAGSLVGSRISLGRRGGDPVIAFDGSNYLVAWSNIAKDSIYGQFINPSGILSGSSFVIAYNINGHKQAERIIFGDNAYMVIYKNNDIIYGQCVGKLGNLIGSATQISQSAVNDNDIAFDGTNYLVVWAKRPTISTVADEDIYGQFISQSGVLVGANFIIDDGNYASDNPLSVSFDGSRYLVAFHEQAAAGGGWNLFAHFISTSGVVPPNRYTISDSTNKPGLAFTAFDGTNYLITWGEQYSTSNAVIKGNFFNPSGVPIGSEFNIFNRLGNKQPFYGAPMFNDNKFLVITTRVDTTSFSDGDVYGKFIQSSTTGITQYTSGSVVYNLYPNPTGDFFTLNIQNIDKVNARINIYDVVGNLVRSEKCIQNQQKINTENLSSGIYMVEVISDILIEKQKLIIQR